MKTVSVVGASALALAGRSAIAVLALVVLVSLGLAVLCWILYDGERTLNLTRVIQAIRGTLQSGPGDARSPRPGDRPQRGRR